MVRTFLCPTNFWRDWFSLFDDSLNFFSFGTFLHKVTMALIYEESFSIRPISISFI